MLLERVAVSDEHGAVVHPVKCFNDFERPRRTAPSVR